jgi:hypothetical protein
MPLEGHRPAAATRPAATYRSGVIRITILAFTRAGASDFCERLYFDLIKNFGSFMCIESFQVIGDGVEAVTEKDNNR